MANKVKVEFDADSRKFQRGIEQVNTGLDQARARATRLKGAIGAAFAAFGVTGAAVNQFRKADEILRAEAASGIDASDLQRIAWASRIGVDDSGDILATLGESIADAQTGTESRILGLNIFGLTPDQVKGKSALEVFKMMGRIVSAMNPHNNDLELGLMELGLGDQSRYLKPLLRGDTDKMLAESDPFVYNRETLNRLQQGLFRAEMAAQTVDMGVADTISGALSVPEKLKGLEDALADTKLFGNAVEIGRARREQFEEQQKTNAILESIERKISPSNPLSSDHN